MQIRDNPIAIYIMSCYAYEELNSPFISDIVFDKLGKYIYDNWDDLEHKHKRFIDREGCAYTSALTVGYSELPTIIREATKQIFKDKNENSFMW